MNGLRHSGARNRKSESDKKMRYVRDITGRFSMRPHYEPGELDRECEKVLREFFGGRIPSPIQTDDLAKLIERDTSDFDAGCDLSSYGQGVEGVTEFKRGYKPRVRIAADLAYDDVRQNRYRTTLTHEFGHVHFHGILFETEPQVGDLFDQRANKGSEQVCKRDGIINARSADWMEWQAGYVCGAMLMPISHLRQIVSNHQNEHQAFGPLPANGAAARVLIEKLRQDFLVSADCARVRLMQLGHLAVQGQGTSLFN
jgi:hypothetical protein